MLLLTACAVPKSYRGEVVAGLIACADFPEAARVAPGFTRKALYEAGRLEYEYFQAKEGTRVCVRCQERQRQQLENLERRERLVNPSPPLPPVP